MKKGFKNLVIFSLVVGLALCVAGFCMGAYELDNWAEANTNIRVASGMYKESLLVNEKTTEDINKVDIDIKSKNVKIIIGSTNEVSLQYYSDFKDEFTYSVENGVLSLTQKYNKKFFGNALSFLFNKSEYWNLSIIIPEKLYDSVNVKTTSGDIIVDGLNATDTYFKAVSGDIELSNLTANKLETNCTSGHIQLKNSNIATDYNSYVISGGILLDTVSIGNNTTLKGTSSGIRINNSLLNSSDIDNTSGSVKINNTKFNSVDVNVTSGSVQFTGIEADFSKTNFKGNSVSGSVYINGSKKGNNFNQTVTDPIQSITAKTVSGSIRYN